MAACPDKDDLLDGFAALYGDVMYFGADRYANERRRRDRILVLPGRDQHALERRVHAACTPSATCSSSATSRTVAPRPRSSSMHGSAPAARTAPSSLLGAGVTCTEDRRIQDEACGIANETATPAPWPYTPKEGAAGTFPQFSFFEGGVDLSQVFPSGNAPVLLQLPDRDPLVGGGQRPAEGLHHGRIQHVRPAHDHDGRLGRHRRLRPAGHRHRELQRRRRPGHRDGRLLHLHPDRSHGGGLPRGRRHAGRPGRCRHRRRCGANQGPTPSD